MFLPFQGELITRRDHPGRCPELLVCCPFGAALEGIGKN